MVALAMLEEWLDLMILEDFSNLNSRVLEVLEALIQKREVPPHFPAGIGDFWVGSAGIGV